MEYMNPFSGSMAPEQVPNNPFASRYNQLDNQEKMAPFMQMEKQRQQLGIQELQQKQQEFASPEASTLRMQERKTKIATSQADEAEATAKLRRMPEEEKIRVMEIRNRMMTAQGAPQVAAFKFFADMASTIEKTPEAGRALAWQRAASQFQEQNPGAQLPPQLQNYSSQALKGISDLRLAQIMSPAHVQKLEEEAQKTAGHSAGTLAVAQEQRRGSMAETQVREGGANARHAETLRDGKRNVGQMRAQQTAILNNPKSSPQQMEEAEENLRSLATSEFANVMKADKALESMGITAIGKSPDSPEVQALQKYQGGLWETHLERMGVVVKMKHPTKKQRNGQPEIQLVPKSRYKEAKEAGFVDSK